MKTLKSFKYALAGVKSGLEEHNMRVHVIITILVIVMGFIFSITSYEWIAILLSIGLVIATELMNTALEELGDIITDAHPTSYSKAGKPKDISAGAVLVTATIAACVGMIVFLPYILKLAQY